MFSVTFSIHTAKIYCTLALYLHFGFSWLDCKSFAILSIDCLCIPGYSYISLFIRHPTQSFHFHIQKLFQSFSEVQSILWCKFSKCFSFYFNFFYCSYHYKMFSNATYLSHDFLVNLSCPLMASASNHC